MRCRLLPPVLLAFACLALPAAADPAAPPPRPTNLRPDILYTHKGEFVQVKPMRALTLNAHVMQFAYDPLGLEIAVVGSETSGDQTTQFVKTLDARTGHEISRLAVSAPTEDKSVSFLLTGWSQSGKYLLVQRETVNPENPDKVLDENLRWNLGASPATVSVISPKELLPAGAEADGSIGSLSPTGRWATFQQFYTGADSVMHNLSLLYDPEQDKFVPLPDNRRVMRWLGKDELELFHRDGDQRDFSSYNVVTGKETPRTEEAGASPSSNASSLYTDLVLDTQAPEQTEAQHSGGTLPSFVIWIKRTPLGRLPLGAAAAGLMPNYREENTFPNPQAAWSPTGKQVAFIANHDLYTTDVAAATGLLPSEKMAVGLKLSCSEEQELAMTSLKQIGLGIIQYTQDNDEKFPVADGWKKTILPYLQSPDVFSVDGHAAVYEQPADLSLAKMESPAVTEEAYIDLPYARIVLFCDGHVKVFPK